MAESKTFWQDRAKLGLEAGTKDTIAKQLEIQEISKYIRDGMRILDVGCGNGITAIDLATHFQVDVLGLDISPAMISEATRLASDRRLLGSVRFTVGDVTNIIGYFAPFDMVYTERVLINLDSWDLQKKAILNIGNLLDTGSVFVMCECSQSGLERLNLLRAKVGLTAITPPWHDRYIRDDEVNTLSNGRFSLEKVVDFSSTYYFLSRITNAWLSEQSGKEPDYQSLINQLALQLPSTGNVGQVNIWLWRKE